MIGEVERPGPRPDAARRTCSRRLERERFASPRLVELRADWTRDGQPPSRQIARLGRLIRPLDSPKNQFFAPIRVCCCCVPTHLACAIERWRRRSGPAVAALARRGRRDRGALRRSPATPTSIPADPFPELVEGEVLLRRRGARPSAARRRRAAVRNDVRLGGEPRVLIVSGSNMSGKSTLLRTVGDERGAGAGRRAGAGAAAAALAARGRRLDPHPGLAAERARRASTPRSRGCGRSST